MLFDLSHALLTAQAIDVAKIGLLKFFEVMLFTDHVFGALRYCIGLVFIQIVLLRDKFVFLGCQCTRLFDHGVCVHLEEVDYLIRFNFLFESLTQTFTSQHANNEVRKAKVFSHEKLKNCPVEFVIGVSVHLKV